MSQVLLWSAVLGGVGWGCPVPLASMWPERIWGKWWAQ